MYEPPKCPVCEKPEKPSWGRDVEDEVEYCECKPERGEERDFDSFIDWRGNKVEVGDLIAYPVVSGRSGMIATGFVERIYVKAAYRRWFMATRLRVVPVDRAWWNLYASKPDQPYEDRKRSTLMFWDRCILLEKLV